MKVMFISTIIPKPIDCGKKVVINGILEYLISQFGASNVCYVTLEPKPPAECFEYEIVTVNKPSTSKRLLNVIWLSFILRQKSIQESMVFAESIQKYLDQIIEKREPDLVICDTLRIGQYFERPDRNNNPRYILYMEDLFSVRYYKTYQAIICNPGIKFNVLGNFAKFIPNKLIPFMNSVMLQKLLLKIEYNLITKREISCIEWFESNLLVSSAEVNQLKLKSQSKRIKVIKPILAKQCIFERTYDGLGEFEIVFLGSLNLPANSVAIESFLKQHMSKLVELIPRVKLRIIGRGADNGLLKIAKQYEEHVFIEGFVDNLDIVFSNCAAVIIPLLFGSGIKLKTLDALSRGVPIVSTDYGVEGIPVDNGIHCIVENDIGRYPEILLRICNVDLNHRMSKNAKEFYDTHYSTEQILSEYKELFESEN